MVSQDIISLEVFNPDNPQDRIILELPRRPSMLYTRLPQNILENLGIDTGFKIPYLIAVDVGNDKLKSIPLCRG
ncbi:MAG: hypothetical protein QXU28_03985 [Nitrososphaerota archaeon]